MARSRKLSTGRALAIAAARLADDRHCNEVVVLDLKGISPVTDYFVIATGTSDRQMRSVANEIMAEAAKSGQRPYKTAGLESSQWIVADFVDVVVHLFDEAHRKYYDLELIWGDAPRLRWRRRTPALVQEGREDEPTG